MASYYQSDEGGTPPPPPPKPGGGGGGGGGHLGNGTSRMATPTTASSFVSPTPPPQPVHARYNNGHKSNESSQLQQIQTANLDDQTLDNVVLSRQSPQRQQLDMLQQQIPDPGDDWVPEILHEKSIQDLATILASPSLLHALTHAASSPSFLPQDQNTRNSNSNSNTPPPAAVAHPSLTASHARLSVALADNAALAARLLELETRLSRARAATQAQLLSTHALARQWCQRQADMDLALACFSPSALYQELVRGVQEQSQLCQAMEDSFLEGGGGAGRSRGRERSTAAAGEETMTEREVADWIKTYREAKVLYYLRQERKARWDEGRVGGWR